MFNSSNIATKIRTLRKQHHLSQEKMAEDLGLYQADISNLEHAVSGSGISDLFKLDMIADYFGITLTELLTDAGETPSQASTKACTTCDTCLNYVISDVRYGCQNDFDVYASELKLKTHDRHFIYMSFLEVDYAPYFFKTKESIYDKLITVDDVTALLPELKASRFLAADDYVDVFNKAGEYTDICRFLIYVATADASDAEAFVQSCMNKSFNDFKVPDSDREPEELINVDYSDLSAIYRYRLMVETNLKYPSVYCDMDGTVKKREKVILAKLKDACQSEDAYKVWKKDLIDAKVKEVMEKQHIVTCTYFFIGYDHYKEMMPEEMVPSFKDWIDHNGSAILTNVQPANKAEIRSYVAQHIADELF